MCGSVCGIVENVQDWSEWRVRMEGLRCRRCMRAGKKGHHMGDYIPPEELEKFLAKCNDAKAAKAAKATADRAKIQADNVGHRLLSKMGWKEGGMGGGRGEEGVAQGWRGRE